MLPKARYIRTLPCRVMSCLRPAPCPCCAGARPGALCKFPGGCKVRHQEDQRWRPEAAPAGQRSYGHRRVRSHMHTTKLPTPFCEGIKHPRIQTTSCRRRVQPRSDYSSNDAYMSSLLPRMLPNAAQNLGLGTDKIAAKKCCQNERT